MTDAAAPEGSNEGITSLLQEEVTRGQGLERELSGCPPLTPH